MNNREPGWGQRRSHLVPGDVAGSEMSLLHPDRLLVHHQPRPLQVDTELTPGAPATLGSSYQALKSFSKLWMEFFII